MEENVLIPSNQKFTTIWKFEVKVGDQGAYVEVPRNAHIIHVALQNGIPCFWALVDENAPKVIRKFGIVGTGHPLRNVSAYYGTFFSGPFVWHLVELEQ